MKLARVVPFLLIGGSQSEDTGDDSDSEVPPQPTSDVLARYLDT